MNYSDEVYQANYKYISLDYLSELESYADKWKDIAKVADERTGNFNNLVTKLRNELKYTKDDLWRCENRLNISRRSVSDLVDDKSKGDKKIEQLEMQLTEADKRSELLQMQVLQHQEERNVTNEKLRKSEVTIMYLQDDLKIQKKAYEDIKIMSEFLFKQAEFARKRYAKIEAAARKREEEVWDISYPVQKYTTDASNKAKTHQVEITKIDKIDSLIVDEDRNSYAGEPSVNNSNTAGSFKGKDNASELIEGSTNVSEASDNKENKSESAKTASCLGKDERLKDDLQKGVAAPFEVSDNGKAQESKMKLNLPYNHFATEDSKTVMYDAKVPDSVESLKKGMENTGNMVNVNNLDSDPTDPRKPKECEGVMKATKELDDEIENQIKNSSEAPIPCYAKEKFANTKISSFAEELNARMVKVQQLVEMKTKEAETWRKRYEKVVSFSKQSQIEVLAKLLPMKQKFEDTMGSIVNKPNEEVAAGKNIEKNKLGRGKKFFMTKQNRNNAMDFADDLNEEEVETEISLHRHQAVHPMKSYKEQQNEQKVELDPEEKDFQETLTNLEYVAAMPLIEKMDTNFDQIQELIRQKELEAKAFVELIQRKDQDKQNQDFQVTRGLKEIYERQNKRTFFEVFNRSHKKQILEQLIETVKADHMWSGVEMLI